jgi:rare lipoprotein A
MKFRVEYFFRRSLPLGLILALAACGNDSRPAPAAPPPSNGPAADYPIVIGEPFTIDGVTYTPVDTLNYDEVGYATLDGTADSGVTASHRTLPLPSYVEVTSLETGRTILVRVERRGPMEGKHLIALSPDAQKQLGSGENTPVRVRRVNPPEQERALLRRKEAAPLRMETPKSLVEVLQRKLPAGAGLSAKVEPDRPAPPSAAAKPASGLLEAAEPEADVSTDHDRLAPAAVEKPAPVASRPTHAPAPEKAGKKADPPQKPMAATEGFIVQVGAFSTEDRAKRVADALQGRVKKSGTLWLSQTGPFATRKEAEASLAKVTAKGYSGARIYRSK